MFEPHSLHIYRCSSFILCLSWWWSVIVYHLQFIRKLAMFSCVPRPFYLQYQRHQWGVPYQSLNYFGIVIIFIVILTPSSLELFVVFCLFTLNKFCHTSLKNTPRKYIRQTPQKLQVLLGCLCLMYGGSPDHPLVLARDMDVWGLVSSLNPKKTQKYKRKGKKNCFGSSANRETRNGNAPGVIFVVSVVEFLCDWDPYPQQRVKDKCWLHDVLD